jgi:chromosome partitioning protein
VNLSAALAELGHKVLLLDLDGQAASSRWLGVEEDSRLADAILAGGGLVPLATHVPNLYLAPGSGRLDSIAHDLRPTQGGQLRRVLAELEGQFDYVLMDCPPSLGNRLIGNALLAAREALVPVETSILALDGLRILLTVIEDVRKGFDHEIELLGVLPCRYDSRTRLSRLVVAELERALPGKIFHSRIREAVRIRECPAVSQTIFEYAPECHAAQDYRSLAREVVEGLQRPRTDTPVEADLASDHDLTPDERRAVAEFRQHAADWFHPGHARPAPQPVVIPVEQPPPADEPQPVVAVVPAAQVDQPEPAPSPAVDLAATQEQAANDAPPAEEQAGADVPADAAAEPTEDRPSDQPPRPCGPGWRRWLVPAAGSVVVLLALATAAVIMTIRPAPRLAAGSTSVAAVSPNPARPMPRVRPGSPLPAAPLGRAAAPQSPAKAAASPAPAVAPPKAAANPATPARSNPAPAATVNPPAPPARTDGSGTPLPAGKADAPPATQPSGPAPTSQPAKATPVPSEPEYIAPPSDLSLSAVMIGSKDGLAVINGKILQVGQSINKARVVQIVENAVELERDGKRFVLRIGVMQAAGK